MADATPPKPPEKPTSSKEGGGGERGVAEQMTLLRLTGLGLELTAGVLLFVGIGWWLDAKLDSSPWATLILGTLGVAGGLYHFIRKTMK